jgi:DNA-binding MarR family transcriptional regulator
LSTGARAKERISAVLDASRAYSTAAVMLHALVAERIGLSTADLKTLDLLQRVGAQTAGEIAAHTGLATASVTAMIDRLAQKGLVSRVRDRSDRRRVIVSLTSKVERSIAPFFAPLSRRMIELSRAYTGEQLATIEAFLASATAEMRGAAAKIARRARP